MGENIFIRKDQEAVQNGYEKELPLISVIIPVYKVENCLSRCIESVLAQTYTNLEIILVDDGSPDRSGEICEEYAKKDNRIRVIHKANGGQSSARNAALKLVRGKYIGFVDSDDYLESDMYETLYNGLLLNDAEIAVCGFIKVFEDGHQEIENAFKNSEILRGEELLNVFLADEKIGSHPCNKLFSANLFSSVEFPAGRVYEDLAIMHKVFHLATSVVCLAENKYYYCIHGDSTSFVQNAKWAFGLYQAFADRVVYISDLNISQETFDICLDKASRFAVIGIRRWNCKNKEEAEYINKARQFLRKYRKQIFHNQKIHKKQKIKIFLILYMLWGFKVYYK